jgi:hypothetical protein
MTERRDYCSIFRSRREEGKSPPCFKRTLLFWKKQHSTRSVFEPCSCLLSFLQGAPVGDPPSYFSLLGQRESKREKVTMATESQPEATNVKVMVRMRLFNSRETSESKEKNEKLRPCVKMRGGTVCAIVEHVTDQAGFVHEVEREAFTFDECFWSMPDSQGMCDRPYATQQEVYSKSGALAMSHAFQGFNVCIFAYGQTGAGKTYSMLGSQNDPGISPRLCDDLFVNMERAAQTSKCTLECTFFEIYNEKVRDLFNKKSKAGQYDPPRIRQHPTKGVYVDGLIRKTLASAAEAKELIEKGTNERAMAETKMNKHSSRSHAIFQLQLTQLEPLKGTQKCSTINLVDLAGSEKIKKSEAEGMTFTEATNINKSLSTLRRVIDVLIANSQSKRQQVPPFRESVLTYTLSDSLGGNSKTQMLSAISPHISNIEETLGTLRYALLAKAIVCNAKVNEESNAEAVEAMKDEIENLKRQMRAGGGGGGGVAMMPAEIEKIIAQREEEVKKMEALQEEAQEEFKAREQEMLKQLEVEKTEQLKLTTAVSAQKRDRFAAAFRNAFTISRDKKRIAAADQELVEAKNTLQLATTKADQLTIDLATKTDEASKLLLERDKLQMAYNEMNERSEAENAKLSKATEEAAGLARKLEKELDDVKADIAKAYREREDAVARVTRLQEDMVGLTQAVEREQAEKANVVYAFEEAATKNSLTLDAVRRRKEKYKIQAEEEGVRATALKNAIQIHSQDRNLLLETIKAQQKLLDEKDTLIRVANQAQTEAVARAKMFEELAEKRGKDIEDLLESLREYQSANGRWMMEHSVMEKEVARLRLGQDRNRALMDGISPGSPPQPMAATPRRSQSPSASRTRSPFFRQPRVERVNSTSSMLGNGQSAARAAWQSPR